VGAPSGTVTFLFTDVEGSTQLWEATPDAMSEALERHDTIVRSVIEAGGGYVFSTGGDGFAAAFARAGDAVRAAVEAQRVLSGHGSIEAAPLKVRMGLHTGEADERDGNYFGAVVNRAARLMASAHGGQVVVSRATADLVGDRFEPPRPAR
jgi:class 3 adenylate cyclase